MQFADRLVAWTIARKYLSLFVLREFFIYTCQADGVMDAHLSQHHEWSDYKHVVAYANGTMRTELTRQCVQEMGREKILWALMDPTCSTEQSEAIALNGNDNDGPEGGLAFSRRAHSLALSACRKILKGRIEQLLPKKMVPNEMAILRYHADLRLITMPQEENSIHWQVFQLANSRETAWPNMEADPMPWLDAMQEKHALVVAPELVEKMSKNAAIPPVKLAQRLSLPDVIRRHVMETEVLPPIQREIAEMADIFHTVSWVAARELNEAIRVYCDRAAIAVRSPSGTPPGRAPVIPLRYLQLLGITPLQLDAVRQWVYLYMVHGVADNQFKRQTCDFGCRHLAAFLKVKHYFRLVDQYRTEGRVLILSDEMRRAQIRQLRARLYLKPYEATPPALGKALLCGGCNRWATTVKPAPLWIECRNDEQLMEARARRLEQQQQKKLKGRAFWLHEYLVAPNEPNAGDNWVGLDGERYCRHGKYSKDTLTSQRDRARNNVAENQDEDEQWLVDNAVPEEEEEEEEDEDDDEDDDDLLGGALPETAPVDPVETAVVAVPDDEPDDADNAEDEDDLEYDADRLYFELLDPTITQIDPSNVRMPARFGRSIRAANRPPAAPQPLTQKKKNSAIRAETTRMLHRTMASVLKTLPRMTCRADPLVTVDMVGIYFCRGGGLYGLCVYCGDLTAVQNEKIMSHGLSCMNHGHSGAFPMEHHHTLATLPLVPGMHNYASLQRATPASALLTQRAQRSVAEQASPVMDIRERLLRRHPFVLDTAVPCMYCRSYLTRTVIRVIDFEFQTVEMALCKVCMGALHSFAPTLTIGHHNGKMAEPMAIGVVLKELEHSAGSRRRKQAKLYAKKRLKAVADAVQGVPSLEQATAAADSIPAVNMELSLRDLRRAVTQHPLFGSVFPGLDADRVEQIRSTLQSTPTAATAFELYKQRTALLELAAKLNAAPRT